MMSDDEYDDVDLKQIKKSYKHNYEGDRNEQGKRHGLGNTQFSNGDKYAGQYENGKRHGIGKYIFENSARYEGEYLEGKRKGKGAMTYPDGTVYTGEWDDNRRHGQGIYIYKNGDFYDGEWKEGRKHGTGRYVFANKGIMYDGAWDYDRFEGEGRLITNNYTFAGTFSEQEAIGDGAFSFNNMCAQKGEYIMTRQVYYNKGDLVETFAPKWVCTALVSSSTRRFKNIHLS